MHRRKVMPYIILLILLFTSSVSMSAESGDETDKLISDYLDNTNLASTLIYTASDYAWNRRYEEAESLYREIIDMQPDDTWGFKAQLGLSRLEILNLIAEKDFKTAKENLNLMANEFQNDPELAVALFHIGKEFSWQRRYDESLDSFDRIIKSFPNNPIVSEAELWSARVDICSLIRDKKNEQALAAIDIMVGDFSGQSDLADSIQWISKECEWTNGESFGKANRFDTAGLIYQKLQKFSNPDVSIQADWDAKRIQFRTKILALMDKGNENDIDAAIEQMAGDFAGRAELANELFWIASWYDEQYNKPYKGMALYERIATEFPDSNEGKESVGRAIRIAIKEGGSVTASDIVVNRLTSQAQGTANEAAVLYEIADTYRVQAKICKNNNDPACENICLEKAAQFYNESINSTSESNLSQEEYIRLGRCYENLRRFSDAANCYKTLIDNWPGNKYEAYCLGKMGICYDELCTQGILSTSEAYSKSEQVYKELLEKYPDRSGNSETILKLGWLTFRQGKIDESIPWFEKGLEKLQQNHKPSNILYALANMYERMGRIDKAIKTYNEMQELLPANDIMKEKIKQKLMILNKSANK